MRSGGDHENLVGLSIASGVKNLLTESCEQVAEMHSILAEYHRKLSKEARLDIVRDYHIDLAQRLADEATQILRRAATLVRLHEREKQVTWELARAAIRDSQMKQRAPMRKSKPKSSSSKLSPRSARNADIEMGRRICLRRRETGISQIELAGRLGLSFQQVQKYEKGTNRVGATSFRIPRPKSGLIFPLHTLYQMTKLNGVRRLAEQNGILVNVADDFNPLEWFKIENPDSHGDAAN